MPRIGFEEANEVGVNFLWRGRREWTCACQWAGASTVISATVHGWGVDLAKTNDDCRYVECQLEPCHRVDTRVRSAYVLSVVTVPSVDSVCGRAARGGS